MKNERKVIEINIDDILPNRFQPRIKFDEEAINELSISIKEHGVIQPIVVREVGDKYEIIAGERRYKASVMAGLETIPAVITKLDDKDSAEVALIENVQRQDLTPIEEAVSYRKILDMGYLTQEQLASKLGKSQSAVANKLRLLNLEDEVQEALLNEQISERHARSLLKLENSDMQIEMLNRIISERLTVRKTDEEIDKMIDNNGVEKEINTQPIDFNFESENKEENLFDTKEEINTSNPFFFGNDSSNINEPIEQNNMFNSNDFVDLNKIENEAQDIYPKEEPKDINSFLEPTLLMNDIEPSEVNEQVEVQPEPVQPVQEEPKQEHKFFDFFRKSEPEEKIEQKTEEIVQPQMSQPKSIEPQVEENASQDGKFFNFFNNNEEPEIENNNGFNFNYENEPKEATEVDQKEENNNFNYENKETPVDSVEENKPEEIDANDFNFNYELGQDEEKIETKEENEPIDLNDLLNENVSTNEEFTNLFDNEEEKYTFNEVKPDEIITSEEKEVNLTNDVSQINGAIDRVRELLKELENIGYKVNSEEVDFENKYQITINIEK